MQVQLECETFFLSRSLSSSVTLIGQWLEIKGIEDGGCRNFSRQTLSLLPNLPSVGKWGCSRG